jgi:hypothetical protein
MTCGTPVNRPDNNSFIEGTKIGDVFCASTSSAASGMCIHSDRKQFKTCRCSIITPLGRPVEPDV